MPHIDLIALNEIDWRYAKFSNEIEYHTLKMDQLAKVLDRVSDSDSSLRLMPSASSYKWTPEFVKQIEYHSAHVFGALNPFFEEVFHKIDVEMSGEVSGQLHETVTI